MTDLDTQLLRQALRAPRDPGDPVDVTLIMSRGRRLRRRRRLAAVAGGLCAVAVLAGTATAIATLTGTPSTAGQPVGPAQHQPAKHQLGPSPQHTPLPTKLAITERPATPTPTRASGTPSPGARTGYGARTPARAAGPT